MRTLILGITIVFLTSCYEELHKPQQPFEKSYTEYIGNIDLSNSQKIIINQNLKPTQYVISLSNNQLEIKTVSGTQTINISQQIDWIKRTLQNTRLCRYNDNSDNHINCLFLPETEIRILDYNYDSKYHTLAIAGFCTYEGFCNMQDLNAVKSITTYLDSIRDQMVP